MIKMKKMWTTIKERRLAKKAEKLQKEAIQYLVGGKKLERLIAELREDHQTANGQSTIRNDDTRQAENIHNE